MNERVTPALTHQFVRGVIRFTTAEYTRTKPPVIPAANPAENLILGETRMNAFRRSSAAVLFFMLSALAQTSQNPYDPRLTFAPLTLPDPVNSYRSSNGAPGPNYWQNQADYEMHADLETVTK